MNNMVVVVKPPAGDAFNKLMTFLVENQLDFSVKGSEPIEVPETPTSSQSSEDIDFPAAKKIRKESNFEVPKITSNGSELSDNLADNQLKIPEEEPEVASIAYIKHLVAQIVSESNQTDNFADKVPKEEPSNNVPVAPIAHLKNKMQTTVGYGAAMAIRGRKPINCQVCSRKLVLSDGFHRRQHALSHLSFRTWKCTVCNKLFSRSDSGRDHFRSVHPEVPYTRLVETMSEEEKKLADEIQIICFPSKPIHQTKHQNDH
ncbi:unnamed protein product [Caenorhabditis nigoni]